MNGDGMDEHEATIHALARATGKPAPLYVPTTANADDLGLFALLFGLVVGIGLGVLIGFAIWG